VSGDGIKTSNTDISTKGNQRGIVTLSGGTLNIYAACDGIDAAYNVETSGDVVLNIYTDKYSPYSGTVDTTEAESGENVRYIRFNLNSYNFSVKYYNSDDDYCFVNATYKESVKGSFNAYYYYTFEELTGYDKVQFFIYDETQEQGQDQEYAACSDYMTWNTNYDTLALEASQNSVSYSWTNYTSPAESLWHGGFNRDGMGDGNTDKGEYSTKGIKAANEILISGGVITVKSYDDAIHANGETTLENGETPTGNVTITGGSLTLSSKDDGIHADGDLTVSGGSICITESYEGLEGATILVSGGDISVISSDDGMNSTSTSDIGMTFKGGTVNICAGGDGIDSNSRSQYEGILFGGGEIKIVSTSTMNSAIDTESGYTYEGGKVLAICPSNAMTNEVTTCKNFNTVGSRSSLSLQEGDTVTVKSGTETLMRLEMSCSMNSFVVFLGDNDVSISTE